MSRRHGSPVTALTSHRLPSRPLEATQILSLCHRSVKQGLGRGISQLRNLATLLQGVASPQGFVQFVKALFDHALAYRVEQALS